MMTKPKTTHPIEKADKKAAKIANGLDDIQPIETLGRLSELADQPPMIALASTVLAAGLLRDDRRLARAGGRMLASHLLATGIKSILKRTIDRTRPFLLVEEGRYERGKGKHREKEFNSFPSGHTAGAVAVARAVGREYPAAATPALATATAVALVQVPRAAHYPSDVVVGYAIGWAAEVVVDAVVRRADAAARGAPAP